ncbi:MAG: hypothetical protein Q8N55_00240 [bacterium]|nr:hypothetical protein [bacterium]
MEIKEVIELLDKKGWWQAGPKFFFDTLLSKRGDQLIFSTTVSVVQLTEAIKKETLPLPPKFLEECLFSYKKGEVIVWGKLVVISENGSVVSLVVAGNDGGRYHWELSEVEIIMTAGEALVAHATKLFNL